MFDVVDKGDTAGPAGGEGHQGSPVSRTTLRTISFSFSSVEPLLCREPKLMTNQGPLRLEVIQVKGNIHIQPHVQYSTAVVPKDFFSGDTTLHKSRQ